MNLKDKVLRIKTLSDTLRDLACTEQELDNSPSTFRKLIEKTYNELLLLVGERRANIIFKKYFPK